MRLRLSLLLFFSLLACSFWVGVFASPQKTGAAFTCPDGTVLNQDIPSNLSEEDKQAFINGACTAAGSTCTGSSFFGLPVWYKYLEQETRTDQLTGEVVCDIKIEGIKDVWLIVAAVIEILLRVASLVAIGFIIYGGATYILSQGQPDKTKQALMTVINALVGLTISIVAAAVVGFIAGRF